MTEAPSRRNLLLALAAVLVGLLLAGGVRVAGAVGRDGLRHALTLLHGDSAQLDSPRTRASLQRPGSNPSSREGGRSSGSTAPLPGSQASRPGRTAVRTTDEGADLTARAQVEARPPTVTVLSETGEPLAGAIVEILDREQRVTWKRPVDLRGERLLSERGAWVRASASGYASSETHAYPRGPLEIRLQPGGSVEGRVTDARGAPLPEVSVVIARSVGRTDGSGRFSLQDVLPGRRRLWLSAPGRYQLPLSGQALTVVPGRTTRVSASMRSGGAVRGRVLDAQGAPQADVRLLLSGALTRVARTDADGAFHIDGVPPGQHRIEADRGGDVLTHALFTLASDRDEVTLELRIPAGITLRGRVLAADGTPAPDAQVRAVRVEDAGLALRQVTVGQVVRTDEGGHFEIDRLPPGTYRVEASPTGDGEAPFFTSGVVAPDVEHDVELPPTRSVRGLVTDGLGNPLANAQVEAVSVSVRVTARTDARGAFSLILPDLPTSHPTTLRASAAGYAPITATAQNSVTLALRPAAALLVEVRDGGGRLLAAPQVDVLSPTAALPRTSTAGPGLVRLFPLAPGPHRLRVGAPGAVAPVELVATALAERDAVVSVTLALALGVVEGHVEDTLGAAVVGARITTAQQDTTSDASGAFRLEGVPAEGLRARIQRPGYAPLLRRLLPGRATITLGVGVPLNGTALRANGSPAANLELVLVDVSVASDPRVINRTRTQADGRFGFLNVRTDTPGLAWRIPGEDQGHLLALSLPAPSALRLQVEDPASLLRR